MLCIRWVKGEYNNPNVMILENGWSDEGDINDVDRIDYMRVHLKAVLEARELGCNVVGYTHWSVVDNFEWTMGYRYILIHIFLNAITKCFNHVYFKFK